MATPAYSGVQGNGGGSASATTVVTGSITTTTGCALIAAIAWDVSGGQTTTGVAGGGGGITWTSKIAKFVDTRNNTAMQVYLGTGYTGAAGAVTCTFNTGTLWRAISVWEVTNPHATQFDASATDVADTGTGGVNGLLTTTVDDCYVCGFVQDDSGSNTITLPANMSSINNFNIGVAAATHYRTTNPAASATSVDWTFSGTDQAINAVMAVAPSTDSAVEYPARSRLFLQAVHRAASY